MGRWSFPTTSPIIRSASSWVWAAEVVESGTCIGRFWVGRSRGRLELAYTFVPSSWGRGYASEAATAVIGWARETQDDPDLIAVTQVANTRSRALLERLGFVESERFVEYEADQCLYLLVRPSQGDPASRPTSSR